MIELRRKQGFIEYNKNEFENFLDKIIEIGPEVDPQTFISQK